MKRNRPQVWDVELNEPLIDQDLRYSDLGSSGRTYLQRLEPLYKYRKGIVGGVQAAIGIGIYKVGKRIFGPNEEDKMDLKQDEEPLSKVQDLDKKSDMPNYNRRKRVRSMQRRGRRKRRKLSLREKVLRMNLAVQTPAVNMYHKTYKYNVLDPGKDIVIFGGSVRDTYHYNQLVTAVGEGAVQFGTTALNSINQYCTGARLASKIQNMSTNPCYATAYKCWVKKDLRDSDFDSSSSWAKSSETIIEMMYQGILAQGHTTTDGLYAKVLRDADDRYQTYMTMPAVGRKFTAQFLQYFGVKKIGTRRLEAGDECRVSIKKNNVKRLYGHVHINQSGNHTSQLHSGHTQFILWHIRGHLIATSEIEGAAQFDDRIDSGSMCIAIEQVVTHELKITDSGGILYQYDEDVGRIAAANEIQMMDNDMDADQPPNEN